MLTAKIFPNGEYSIYPSPAASDRKKPRRKKDNPLSRVDLLVKGHDGIIRVEEQPGSSIGDFLLMNPSEVRVYRDIATGTFVLAPYVSKCVLDGKEEYQYVTIRDRVVGTCTLPRDIRFLAVCREGNPTPQFVRFVGKLPPLVHQLIHSSDKRSKPTPRKTLGFRGRRLVRNLVHQLQESEGKDNLSFLTLTIPNYSPEFLLACRERWGQMISALLDAMSQKSRRELSHPLRYVSVTEIQEKRFIKHKELAPHEHIVFVGRGLRGSMWLYSPKKIRKLWYGIVERHCGSVAGWKPGLSGFKAAENIQRIKRDASRYLSKYLSKGTGYGLSDYDKERYAVQANQFSCRWYRASRELYKRMHQNTRVFRSLDPSVVPALRDKFSTQTGQRVGYFIHKVINTPVPVSSQPAEAYLSGLVEHTYGIHIYLGTSGVRGSKQYGEIVEMFNQCTYG